MGLHFDAEPRQLNQKGNLLIELKEYEKELELFERVKKVDSSMVNTS